MGVDVHVQCNNELPWFMGLQKRVEARTDHQSRLTVLIYLFVGLHFGVELKA